MHQDKNLFMHRESIRDAKIFIDQYPNKSPKTHIKVRTNKIFEERKTITKKNP